MVEGQHLLYLNFFVSAKWGYADKLMLHFGQSSVAQSACRILSNTMTNADSSLAGKKEVNGTPHIHVPVSNKCVRQKHSY